MSTLPGRLFVQGSVTSNRRTGRMMVAEFRLAARESLRAVLDPAGLTLFDEYPHCAGGAQLGLVSCRPP